MDNNTIDMKNYINHLIDKELDKPLETQDMNLIHEYSAYFDELEVDEIDITSESYLQNKAINISKILNYEKEFNNKNTKKKLKLRWRFLIVAAVMVSLFTIANIIAIANDYNLFENIGAALFNFTPGETVNVDGFDVVFIGETREYSTIEEFMEGEGIESFLYPTYVPDGYELNLITGSGEARFLDFSFIYYYENEQTFDFTFTLDQRNAHTEHFYSEENNIIIEKNSIKFYLFKAEHVQNEIHFFYNGFAYAIYSSDVSILENIIDGIKIININ